MNDEHTVPVTLTVAYAAWAVALLMYAAAVVTYILSGGWLAILIAEGACIVSAMAATVHIKHFGGLVCRVVRDRDQLTADIQQLRAR